MSKVKLRPICHNDTDNVLRWRNAPDVQMQFVYRDNLTHEVHEKWLKNNVKTGDAAQFIIETEEFGDIGTVYLRDIDKKNSKAEFGILIGDGNYRGRGFGSEATRLILNYAFGKIGLNKVFLRVLKENEAAIRSYERVGFRREGCFIHDVIIDDMPRDMVFMAVLRENFVHST